MYRICKVEKLWPLWRKLKVKKWGHRVTPKALLGFFLNYSKNLSRWWTAGELVPLLERLPLCCKVWFGQLFEWAEQYLNAFRIFLRRFKVLPWTPLDLFVWNLRKREYHFEKQLQVIERSKEGFRVFLDIQRLHGLFFQYSWCPSRRAEPPAHHSGVLLHFRCPLGRQGFATGHVTLFLVASET